MDVDRIVELQRGLARVEIAGGDVIAEPDEVMPRQPSWLEVVAQIHDLMECRCAFGGNWRARACRGQLRYQPHEQVHIIRGPKPSRRDQYARAGLRRAYSSSRKRYAGLMFTRIAPPWPPRTA